MKETGRLMSRPRRAVRLHPPCPGSISPQPAPAHPPPSHRDTHRRRLGQEQARGTVIRDTRSFRHRRAGARGPPMSSRPHLPPAAVDYPSSDGKPLAENDLQAPRHSLRLRRAAGALPRAPAPTSTSPRTCSSTTRRATRGCRSRPMCSWSSGSRTDPRMSYKVWEEGKGPDFRAGGGVAEHVGGGRGEEARHLRGPWGAGSTSCSTRGRSSTTRRGLQGYRLMDGAGTSGIGRPWSPSTAR